MRRERGSGHNSVVSNHLTDKEKEVMNGAIGRARYLEPEGSDQARVPHDNVVIVNVIVTLSLLL